MLPVLPLLLLGGGYACGGTAPKWGWMAIAAAAVAAAVAALFAPAPVDFRAGGLVRLADDKEAVVDDDTEDAWLDTVGALLFVEERPGGTDGPLEEDWALIFA